MRHSSLRHPVAVVRKIIGLSQPEFSRLAGIAESTLAKIESLRLPLSKQNAIRIADETGVSMRWLLKGNPQDPPPADEFRFTTGGKSPQFDQSVFERRRAQIEAGTSSNIQIVPYNSDIELKAMSVTAGRRDRQYMFNHKLRAAVDDLAKEFPVDPGEMKRQEREIFARRELEYSLAQFQGRTLANLLQTHAKDDSAPLLLALSKWAVCAGVLHAVKPFWSKCEDVKPAKNRVPRKTSRRKKGK